MRKIILSLALFLSIGFQMNAQTVVNGSFEDWQVTNFFEEPDNYTTTNFQAYFTMGTANVIKTTDAHSGNYATLLQTVAANGLAIPGGLFMGDPGSSGVTGGYPFSGHPDSLEGWTKFNLVTGDTAMVIAFFSIMGTTIGISSITFGGVQSSYMHFSTPVDFFVPGVNPDTITLYVFSSNSDILQNQGSLLYLDDLHFTNTTEQLPNPGFENWTPLSAEEPLNWTTSNAFTMPAGGVSVTKASSGYDGNFAVQLMNQASMGGDTTSFITNGYIGDGPTGGMPVIYNPDKISFYYKYFPNGPDSALAGGWSWIYEPIQDSTILIEKVMHRLPAASAWTYHEIPFTYNSFPLADTVTIAFSAGNVDNPGSYIGLGSILFVDKVELSLQTNNVSTLVGNDAIRIFPNPASDVIKVEGNIVNAGKVGIYDICGKLIMEFPLQAGNSLQETNISQLKSGTYSYQINTGTKLIKGKFVKL